jgi:Leucine-rich repeat (LRR) protein
MSNLAVLYIQNCTLTDLPNLSGIPNLQYIDLGHNQLSTVEGLTGVVNLDLSNNLFVDIPTLNTPNTLRYLDMNNNPLENMLAITSHVNLNRVLLRNTTLSFIPATIDRLQQVISLDLSYNKLLELPRNMLDLANLQHLDIQSNQVSSARIQELKTEFNRILPNLTIVT